METTASSHPKGCRTDPKTRLPQTCCVARVRVAPDQTHPGMPDADGRIAWESEPCFNGGQNCLKQKQATKQKSRQNTFTSSTCTWNSFWPHDISMPVGRPGCWMPTVRPRPSTPFLLEIESQPTTAKQTTLGETMLLLVVYGAIQPIGWCFSSKNASLLIGSGKSTVSSARGLRGQSQKFREILGISWVSGTSLHRTCMCQTCNSLFWW